ncbi:polysaccharide pyruvyl transferase family protein [Papillibacter cinnamivorans]|uniref:Coenzyme F420-reducing hydrogenase, beta subunit n=1 Tax=Papillibacter cinnamivorans DSM 12816 TaxID=1122930 RepID=A0A1W2B844_9FIRM|nr:polysaccharide pyruvyl transferase family protein [Papillibacter cinnamivorans]SMC68862.1 Coenzyme F420-reducing hydrogenase, beta subunit [Papillibacter cinnamivorans DSM 12816]
MPKAGLITFHFAHHYGAQLQAYALMAAVDRLGHTCEIIDYRLPHTTGTNRLFQPMSGLRSGVYNAHTALHYPPMKARHDRFEAFVSEHMRLGPRRYETIQELCDDPPRCDVLLAGSDQIWNPFIFQSGHFDPSFFLAFPGESPRAAYAPSFGVSSIPDEMQEELRGYLSRFAALSSREARGSEIIEEISGRRAETVLDPTLLLTGEDWSALAKEPDIRSPYILCYFISDFSVLEPYARRLAAETGLPLVHLAGMRRHIPGSRVIYDAGPREFLGWFRGASFVLTNSFHGTVFSLQFQKPFFTAVSPKEQIEPSHSRTYSLLHTLGLSRRIAGLPGEAGLSDPVDYAAAEERLKSEREHSLSFLRAGLRGEELPRAASESAEPGGASVCLCKAADCTGCGACFNVCPAGAISMEPDREGFLRPVLDDSKCIRCLKCQAACPVLAQTEPRPQGKVYAARNKDADVLSKSTSGGFFSVLAIDILSRGGTVFGAAFDDSMVLRHRGARNEEELGAFRGAKYVQSDTGTVFREVKKELSSGRPVLFSGTPCQVDGLYHFLGNDSENLLTCDLVCHGVPSPAVFFDWVHFLENRQRAKITEIRFRDKRKGWAHSSFTARLSDGREYVKPLMDTGFGRGFGMALFLRPSCHRCRYSAASRRGDFTLGDFWGLAPGALPGGEEQGASLVLVNSEKASSLFERLSPGFECVPRSMEEAVAGNPRLSSPIAASAQRGAFFSAWRLLPFEEVSKRFLVPALSRKAAARLLGPGVKAKIRKIIGG